MAYPGYGLVAWYPGGNNAWNSQDEDTYPVNTSATFVAGDFVIYSTGLTIAAAAGNNYSPSSATLYGFALAPAVQDSAGGGTTQATSVTIVKAQPGVRVCLPLYDATASSATWAPSLIGGTGYELRSISAGVWGVDIATQTHPVVRILSVVPEAIPTWPNTTASFSTPLSPFVICEFIGGICALTGAR